MTALHFVSNDLESEKQWKTKINWFIGKENRKTKVSWFDGKERKKTPKQAPPKQLLVQISGLKNDGDGDCSIGMLYLNLLAIDMFNLSLERTNYLMHSIYTSN